MIKNSPVNAGRCKRCWFDPELGRVPVGVCSNPLQYSCLENPMDRGARPAKVHSVAKSRTQVKEFSMHAHMVTRSLGIPSGSDGKESDSPPTRPRSPAAPTSPVQELTQRAQPVTSCRAFRFSLPQFLYLHSGGLASANQKAASDP